MWLLVPWGGVTAAPARGLYTRAPGRPAPLAQPGQRQQRSRHAQAGGADAPRGAGGCRPRQILIGQGEFEVAVEHLVPALLSGVHGGIGVGVVAVLGGIVVVRDA